MPTCVRLRNEQSASYEGLLSACPVDCPSKCKTASSFIESKSTSGGNEVLADGKKASTMHHGEALKFNNDCKAVLGNCTDGALAGKEK